ncbi:MAG: hypothetical protein ABSG50_15745 [Opitutaceae bacterium]|jgi:hypothetical protein
MPFVKLDVEILTSTLWLQRPDLEIFITALLLSEPKEFTEPTPTLETDSLTETNFVLPPGWYGFAGVSGPGLVRAAVVDVRKGREALRRLPRLASLACCCCR